MSYWSWVLAITGIFGIVLVGNQSLWGWPILFINEMLWLGYSISTAQYGFFFMSIAYSVVYVRSFLLWKRTK